MGGNSNEAGRPSGSCVLHSLTALTVVTVLALGLCAGLHIAELVKFKFSSATGRDLVFLIKTFALHIFGCLFCAIGIVVELKVRIFAASDTLSIFQNFAFRGLFYVFIGLDVEFNNRFKRSQAFDTAIDIATWMTIGFGVIYLMLEIFCVRSMAIKRLQRGKEVPLV